MPENIYNLALSLVYGIGPVQAAKILQQVDSAKAFFNMSVTQRIAHFTDIPEKVLSGDFKDALKKAEKEVAWCERNDIEVLTFVDRGYPRRLTHLPDKPLSLFIKGDCDLSALRTVGILGTRRSTEYGRSFVDSLVRDLKPYGVQIISGMAVGIDGAAHEAALKYGIPTIGVLGHGIDMVYPSRHRNLAREILSSQGALITEFAHGTKPEREHFPMRNRIIAGMSDVLIIVESESKGGSMITADLGNNYNKDVFAVPGRHNDKFSSGCNLLIKSQRAHLLESVKDIEYIMQWQRRKHEIEVQTSLFVDLSEEQRELLHLLKHRKELHVDEVSAIMKLSQGKISELLLTLELHGLIKYLPGNIYKAI